DGQLRSENRTLECGNRKKYPHVIRPQWLRFPSRISARRKIAGERQRGSNGQIVGCGFGRAARYSFAVAEGALRRHFQPGWKAVARRRSGQSCSGLANQRPWSGDDKSVAGFKICP